MAVGGGKKQLLRRYVHGPGVDEPLLWYEGAGLSDRRGLLANHQGSTVGVTNSAGGVLFRNVYEEYGANGASNGGRFSFTGQIIIPELALLHYKARVYNPALGRFLQTDPIGYEDQLNLYAYVANDPLNATDPTGENRVVVEVIKWLIRLATAAPKQKEPPPPSSESPPPPPADQAGPPPSFARTRSNRSARTSEDGDAAANLLATNESASSRSHA